MAELQPGFTVYADVLFLVNFVMDFYVFALAKFAFKSGKKVWRTALGAAVSAGLAVVWVCALPVYSVHAASVIASPLILGAGVATAFGRVSFRAFIKTGAACYGLAALTAGACLGLTRSNGGFPFTGLACASALTYITVKYALAAYERGKMTKRAFANVTIKLFGESAEVTGLIDTGCELFEPISKTPAIVADYRCLRKILPKPLYEYFEGGGEPEGIIAAVEESGLKSRVRVIPYGVVGSNDGALYGFSPDEVFIKREGGKPGAKKAVIALTGSLRGDAQALINPKLID